MTATDGHRGLLRLVILYDLCDISCANGLFLRSNMGLTEDGSNPLLMRTIFRTSSLPAQKDSYPPQSVGPDSNGNARIGAPKRQPRKKEKRPQKTGKALWKGLAAAIRFMVFVKRTPAEDHGG